MHATYLGRTRLASAAPAWMKALRCRSSPALRSSFRPIAATSVGCFSFCSPSDHSAGSVLITAVRPDLNPSSFQRLLWFPQLHFLLSPALGLVTSLFVLQHLGLVPAVIYCRKHDLGPHTIRFIGAQTTLGEL